MNTSNGIRKNLTVDTNRLFDNFRKEIELKNLEIKRLNEKDFNIEYEVFEKEIERLFKEYILMKKLPGKDLKAGIVSAMGFINKDIKKHLGIPTPDDNKTKGLFGR
jgi:hypothetical protein